MTQTFYRVTTKIALYTKDYQKVLLVQYRGGDYGLPGGHIDKGESPDEALYREINEELRLDIGDVHLKKTDFWFHPDGKLILGYTGTTDKRPIMTAGSDIVNFIWVDLVDIQHKRLTAGTYDTFILTNKQK